VAELTFTNKDPKGLKVEAVVLGVDSVDSTPTIVGPANVDLKAFNDLNLKALGVSAKADSVSRIPAPARTTADARSSCAVRQVPRHAR
jgi:leucyl aminopeptidase